MNARRVMLVVNLAMVLIGALNATAIVWLQQETVRLREYLASRPAAAIDEKPAAKQNRRCKKR